MLALPATLVVTLPLDKTCTLLVPLLILAGLVSTFVRNAPLPMKYEAVTLPDALMRPIFTLPVPLGVSTMLALPAVVCKSN